MKRRIAGFFVSESILQVLLQRDVQLCILDGLPDGYKVAKISHDAPNARFSVLVTHPSFNEVEDGMPCPMLQVTFSEGKRLRCYRMTKSKFDAIGWLPIGSRVIDCSRQVLFSSDDVFLKVENPSFDLVPNGGQIPTEVVK